MVNGNKKEQYNKHELVQITNTLVWTCTENKYTGVNLHRSQIHWGWTCTDNKYTAVNLYRKQIHWGKLVQITNTLVWTCTYNKYTSETEK